MRTQSIDLNDLNLPLTKEEPFIRVNIVQGSEEWKQLRLVHITASQTPILMGVDPRRKLFSLYVEKTTGKEPEFTDYQQNVIFQLGHEIERAARSWVEVRTGVKFSPAVVISKEYPFLLASLDGMNPSASVIFEAKYVGAAALKDIKSGIIPPHHMVQVQAQLGITGATRCLYFASDESGDSALVEILPEPETFQKIVSAAQEFMKRIEDNNPPESEYFTPTGDERFKRLAELHKEFEALKAQLVQEYKEHGKLFCDGVKITRTLVKGNVRYADIPELKDVDLEKYRGKSTTRTTVSFPKGESNENE